MASQLIVNCLPSTMTDSELYCMFAAVGPIESCKVVKDFNTGYSLEYGFVTYKKPEDAEKAIKTLHEKEFCSKRIKVSYARPLSDIKETKLYVTNLPWYYTEENLDNLFGPYGTILNRNILYDKKTKLPRGAAIVRFDKSDEAKYAMQKLNGVVLRKGSIKRLRVRMAEGHGKQKVAFLTKLESALEENQLLASGSVQETDCINGNNSNTNCNNLVSYPVEQNNSSFGALRHEKTHQRYDPLSFGVPYDGYPAS